MEKCPAEGCNFPDQPCQRGVPNPESACPSLLATLARDSVIEEFIAEQSEKADAAGDETDRPEEYPVPKDIPLHGGGALISREASDILAQRPAKVIVIAGAEKAGKTTLLASMYEQYQVGPFGGFIFAGSLTLLGFEARCYKSRLASGNQMPETERTKTSEAHQYLHLELAKRTDVARRVDLLFADVPGQICRRAIASEADCMEIVSLRRADHLAILVDGERLAQLEGRVGAYDDARLLLRALVESNMVGRQTVVGVVFSKWDLVERADDAEALLEYVASIEAELTDQFAPKLGMLRVFRIKARVPETAKQEGLDDLLQFWAVESTRLRRLPEPIEKRPVRSEFDRFQERELRSGAV
jgi:hypothetical protein